MTQLRIHYSIIVPLFLAVLSLQQTSTASAQELAWARQLGSSGLDSAYGIVADGSGGHYACGRTTGDLFGASNLGIDAWLMRCDGAGNTIWDRQIGTASDDEALAVAGDGQGGVFVGGGTYGDLASPNQGFDDVWLARYDGAGNVLWMNQFGTTSNESLRAVVPDGFGGAILLGETGGQLGTAHAGNFDGWIARIDSGGALQWIQQFGTSAGDLPIGLTPDGSGGAYACGITYGDLAATNAGSYDAWIAHFSDLGVQNWLSQTGSSEADSFSGITVGENGQVYACGVTLGNMPNAGTANAGSWDMVLAEYDTSGNSVWTRQFGTSESDFFNSITPDGNGGLYLGGATVDASAGGTTYADRLVANYNLTTNQLTTIGQVNMSIWNVFGTFVAQDGMGGVFHLGSTGDDVVGPSNGLEDFWIARYYGGAAATTCNPANTNSTGASGTILVSGSQEISDNQLTLVSSGLPQGVMGMYIASQASGFTANPGGSQGNLCLGGQIGRFNGPGQLLNSGATGTLELDIDLTAMVQPTGPVMVLSGQTWYFQAWYRDNNPALTSNFTHAIGVGFQ